MRAIMEIGNDFGVSYTYIYTYIHTEAQVV